MTDGEQIYTPPTPRKKSAKRKKFEAKKLTSAELAACRVIHSSELKSGLLDVQVLPSLIAELTEKSAAIQNGDLAQAEAMLISQATALQSLFARLVERGMRCDEAQAFEVNLRIALRAQSQCRATLETLSAIKNPPVIFAKQANITSGPQQVNNGQAAPKEITHAIENQTSPNKLGAPAYELPTNIKAPVFAGRAMHEPEAVGEIHRAQDQ